MKKFIQQKLKDQKGMTLIELLAVIVIIAIIAAIAIPAIGNIIENSRVGAIKSDALNALAAADLYYIENPTATTVTISTLASPAAGGEAYLDDEASFGAGSTASITPNGIISGTATDGGLTVTFTNADKAAINSTPNNANANTEGAGTVAVTGR